MANKNTIFMTPEEDERVRNAIKGRLLTCQERAGQQRIPRDPKAMQNQVTTASFLSDIGGLSEPGVTAKSSRPDAIVAFAVGRPYPPCTEALQDLQPMKLSELRMESHHRGHVLNLRRISPVVKLSASSWTVVQDTSSDEVERLEMFLHKSRYDEDILELGSVFMLKEPYYTLNDQNEPTLKIDHPSDLIVHMDCVSPSSSSGENGNPADTASAPKTAKEFKDKGNAALKRQELLEAHQYYTQGLKLDAEKEDNLSSDLFRNRAHVNLRLNRLDEAKADAVSSLTGVADKKHTDLDSKAYFRAGCAAYRLGEFEEAKRFFDEELKLAPGDKDAAGYLRKIETRLKEQATGMYDFRKIRLGLSKARPRIDAASFISSTEVRDSPGRGRGLFVTRDIKSGDIVMCEKAFCVVWGHEGKAWTAMTYDVRDDRIRVSPAGLSRAIVQKLSDNPSQIEKFLDLYGDYHGIGKQLIMRDGSPVVDTFQVYDIVSRNGFGPGEQFGEEDVSIANTGSWIWAAYTNHSCLPNVQKEYVGDLILLRATRNINAGEEILHAYDESSDYEERNAALMTTWGFTCTCALCTAEKADDPSLRKKRRELEREANAFVEKEPPGQAKRLTVLKGKRLAQSINSTYDEERYKSLPRTALKGIEKWLAAAQNRR